MRLCTSAILGYRLGSRNPSIPISGIMGTGLPCGAVKSMEVQGQKGTEMPISQVRAGHLSAQGSVLRWVVIVSYQESLSGFRFPACWFLTRLPKSLKLLKPREVTSDIWPRNSLNSGPLLK